MAALGCAGPVRTAPNPAFLRTPPSREPSRALLGWYGSTDMTTVAQKVVDELGGMPWLKQGDRVFVKVACNSSNEHPAVTSPDAIRAVVKLLRDAGAGTVYVGDQSGVEHVRLTAEGRVGSTRETMAENGQLEAIEQSGATLYNFDDQGWQGYFAPADDFANHWEGTLHLPKILHEVDHVVNLPRFGTHGVAGYTCAIKNAVGWIRDDSRLHLHQRGDTFFEQIAEIHLFSPLREKLRLSLTLGREALLNIGPDFGASYDFEGILALASPNLLEHDAVATALLLYFDRRDKSFFDIYAPYPEDADFFNRTLVREIWGREAVRGYREMVTYRLGKGLAYDRVLSHLAVAQGQRPTRVVIDRRGDRFPDELANYLRRYADGLFTV